MTGARVGNWYLEAEIGRGTLGITYRARGYDDPDRIGADLDPLVHSNRPISVMEQHDLI